MCAEQIPLDATICEYCGTKFEVTVEARQPVSSVREEPMISPKPPAQPIPATPPPTLVTKRRTPWGWIAGGLGLLSILILALVCGVIILAQNGLTFQTIPPVNPPTTTLYPTLTPYSTFTPYPTDTVVPTDTLTPTSAVRPSVTPPSLPQEWKGYYKWTGYANVGISIIIEKMAGNAFNGKMYWHANKWYNLTITRMNGEYVQDFGDALGQDRWSKHPDFQSGIGDGTWLKWTETEMISGNSIFTMNGWYYGHLRSDGTMVGIYYMNATETTPATDSWELHLVN